MNKLIETTFKKIKTNAQFWYIENHMAVITGTKITSSMALINGKYTAMNCDAMVYKSDPSKS